MEVFVQSAALYSVFVIIAMGAYLGHSNIQFPIVSATGPVIGIIFCMIVTRAHRFTNGAMKQASLSLRWRTQTEILRPMALHLETRAEGVLSAELRTPPTWPRVDLNTSSEKDIPNGVEVV
ncbi:hypothetical protein Hypma_001903 [Hypsizygus marmoreus]|uniref:Uncharacterized protein n=1 Tax=Hypsizygus marmoreus TaxID=39966 RepID=A0A369J9J2_HYPMA|nr:hypothetical protein Hypma_001903 [Hypsizygus marmoreus]